ncbi:MAG: tellurite resistance TerB family protein [Pseudomonadota bacterium]
MSDTDPVHAFSAQDALVAVMVVASASDESVSAPELLWIMRIIESLPIFEGYDRERIAPVSRTVFDLLEEEEGLDALFGLVREALPESLFETAYALACDVIAADGKAAGPELRLLEEFRHEFDIERLHAAAIERGARARFAHAGPHGLS